MSEVGEPAPAGVTDQDLAGKNAKMMTPVDFANQVADADKAIAF